MKNLLFLLVLFSLLESKSFEQAFNIKTIKPKITTKELKSSYYAITTYDETKLYDVSMRYDGYIEKLYANELFTPVKKGQKLFEAYPKHMAVILKEYEIYRDDEDYKTIIKARLKDHDIDESILHKKELLADFYSKYDGEIVEKNIHIGSYAKRGDIIFKIADRSSMWVVAKVYQKDIEHIRVGNEVEISIDGLSRHIKAKIDKIYPSVSKDDLSFSIRVSVPNRDGAIFAGMFAKVDVKYQQLEALMLPKDAVIKKGDKLYVFVKTSSSTYEPRAIEALFIGGGYKIISGIDEGSEVAQNVLFLLDSDAINSGSYMSEEW